MVVVYRWMLGKAFRIHTMPVVLVHRTFQSNATRAFPPNSSKRKYSTDASEDGSFMEVQGSSSEATYRTLNDVEPDHLWVIKYLGSSGQPLKLQGGREGAQPLGSKDYVENANSSHGSVNDAGRRF